ncbi:ABC transporter ATP-binding protein [Sporosarcina trichiuri]|uniref:ABC transporter ATP-binding protein n=1 Tax=Sporosarcina trichiuri TaxID=3056445 RepID=UPI0025B308E5|nr:ABC transporter ATP-binding protein [Sporosarcina sp. 0.2-SM1T-5]WJY26310.1 ABC transporter ATP-binding protein [Sporosarcina sp. 0.2-SM1T-5]
MERPVLNVEHLKTYFHVDDQKIAKAVDDVSFEIRPGESLSIVGESGSGKSMTANSVMGLISKPGRIEDGSIRLDGRELTGLSDKELERIRGKEMAMIFQEPMTALNPVFTIGSQITEMLRKHKRMGKKAAREQAVRLLAEVGITRPEQIVDEYPHKLSGGMRQRVMIAIAISCQPKLLIADEPTTALDVTIQAQILTLLDDMRKKMDMSILMITHDLGVVSDYADRVIVMYGGQVVEQAPTKELLRHTKHPYTQGLLDSMPDLTTDTDRLKTVPGAVPAATDFPKGCRFASRCPFVMDRCLESNPELLEVSPGHFARCHLYEEEEK